VLFSKNMFTTPTAKGVVMLPGANGGAEWSPAAYSPKTRLVYVLAMDQLMRFTTHPEKCGAWPTAARQRVHQRRTARAARRPVRRDQHRHGCHRVDRHDRRSR
jgi:glucose dehydrogenase